MEVNTPPVQDQLKAEIESLLRQQLLWMLFMRVMLYTLLLGVSFLLQGGEFKVIIPPRNMLINYMILVYVTTIGSAFLLLALESELRKFGFIQILIDTVFASILVYYTGGSNSHFSSVYFFPIIAGGLLLPRKGGLVGASAATLQYGIILGLELIDIYPSFLNNIRFIPPHSPETSLNTFAIRGLTFFLVAILSALFSVRLLKTEAVLSTTTRDFHRLSMLYKQIFDDIATGIITINDSGIITSANNAIQSITGYNPDKLLKKKFIKIFPTLTLACDSTRNASDLTCKDKSIIRVGYSHVKLQAPHPSEGSSTTADTCENCKVITIQDISEIERMEQQMRQTEKLAAIGKMSAGIAHDFRNPLAAISGSAQVLADEIKKNNSTENKSNVELIEIILRESNRLNSTITDFLRFARPETANREWFSLIGCVEEVLQVAKAASSWPHTCKVNVAIEETCDVWADRYQLFIMINHLVQNGLSFCPTGDEQISIQAFETTVSNNKEMLLINIGDNGPGIPEDEEEKIFEPFYTTRVDGTGLGLAIVKQIITVHQGLIETGRSRDNGALFSLYIPHP